MRKGKKNENSVPYEKTYKEHQPFGVSLWVGSLKFWWKKVSDLKLNCWKFDSKLKFFKVKEHVTKLMNFSPWTMLKMRSHDIIDA